MALAIINSVVYGSTGKIAKQLNTIANNNGIESYLFVPKGRHFKNNNEKEKIIGFGSRISEDLHVALGRLTGLHGFFSCFATLNLIRYLIRKKITCIHLHNLHNDYINLSILFKFIKKKKIKIIWTFHDCWPFTGRCPHFTLLNCNKWVSGCKSCHYPLNSYPKTFIRTESILWKMKKKWFSGICDLTIVTPSKWLADLVKASFFKKNAVVTINNGIDLELFKFRKSNFREKYNLEGKYLILGVAYDWGIRKGLDVFIQLAQELPNNYVIVLVGTNDFVDKSLPGNIISIHKTNNQQELVEIYSTADVFFNPTREDNYPTVNMEAIACGLPVITFNTGGSPEIITPETGVCIYSNSLAESLDAIMRVCESNVFDKRSFPQYAQRFDINKKFLDYIRLYKEKCR